jgi:hypothetical protein
MKASLRFLILLRDRAAIPCQAADVVIYSGTPGMMPAVKSSTIAGRTMRVSTMRAADPACQP